MSTQVAAKANKMATKDSAMETMSKLIQQLQGEIKTLKSKQSGQSTNKPDTSGYNKGSWWGNPYFWTHGVGRHNGEACNYKAEGKK